MSARNATEPADARFGFIEQEPGMLLHDVVSDFLNVADFVATHRDNPVADSSVLLDALNFALLCLTGRQTKGGIA